MAEQVAHADAAHVQVADDHARGRLLIFAIVSIALMMASVDQTIVATALPSIQRDLGAQVNWSSWTITVYALGQVMVMPLAGKIGDQFGRKQVFLGAAVLFTAASLCCGLADNIYLLIVLRAVQAIGGGAFMPSATGIVTELFGKDRDRAVGLFASIFPIGGIIGPVLGGVFVTYWSWRGIFLVNIPIGITLVVLGAIFIPDIARRPDLHLDIRGVVLLGTHAAVGDARHRLSRRRAQRSAERSTSCFPSASRPRAATAFVRHSARAHVAVHLAAVPRPAAASAS